MKKSVKYTDEPIEEMKIRADFLPPPKDLIFKDDTVKITISLTKESVEFFKKRGRKAPYAISKNDTKLIGCICE